MVVNKIRNVFFNFHALVEYVMIVRFLELVKVPETGGGGYISFYSFIKLLGCKLLFLSTVSLQFILRFGPPLRSLNSWIHYVILSGLTILSVTPKWTASTNNWKFLLKISFKPQQFTSFLIILMMPFLSLSIFSRDPPNPSVLILDCSGFVAGFSNSTWRAWYNKVLNRHYYDRYVDKMINGGSIVILQKLLHEEGILRFLNRIFHVSFHRLYRVVVLLKS